MILHMLCGLPGSGKSTLVAKLNRYVVSTDSLRKYLWGDEAVMQHDKLVFDVAKLLIAYMLKTGQEVVFDATNLRRKSRAKFISLAKTAKAKVFVHWVNCPVDIAIDRNLARDRKVPVKVIRSLAKSLQRPQLDEGIDRIKVYGKDLRLRKIIGKRLTFIRFP